MPNPYLARFAGEPKLVAPERLRRLEACLDVLAATERGPAMLAEGVPDDDGFWPDPGSWKAAYRPYVVADGMLLIPVKGVLLHDFAFAVGSWATGYVYIRRAFERGLKDASVKGIALVCDSPGGDVAGCFDLVDAIHAAKGTKPVRAFAHEAAYSAAYAIASAADWIVVSRTGGVGSIGVVTFHTDASAALEKAGLKITFVYGGAHKVDGNSTEPLAPEVKARWQKQIDALYAIFVDTVARNRAGLTAQAVRATEALTYAAAEAVQVGLADAVGPLDGAVAAFAVELKATPQGPGMSAPGVGGSQDEHQGPSLADRMRASLGLPAESPSPSSSAPGTFADHVRARHGLPAQDAAQAPGSSSEPASLADRARARHGLPAASTPAPTSPAPAAEPATLADRMRARFDMPAGGAPASLPPAPPTESGTLADRMRARFGLPS